MTATHPRPRASKTGISPDAYDSAQTVGVGAAPAPLESVRLMATPNPFMNGRGDRGRRVAAGVYFARLGVGARHLETKIVKLQ